MTTFQSTPEKPGGMDAIGTELAAKTGMHPGSSAVGTECGGVHARASKTGINV